MADDDDGGRFRQVRGVRCQYEGTLVSMYVGLMMGYTEEATKVVEEMMGKDRFDGQDRKRWYRWFGRLIMWGGIQASQMCRVCLYLGQLEER
jgi:hypothetical protein